MTTQLSENSVHSPEALARAEELVTAAAANVAQTLPSVSPLSPAGVQPGNEHVGENFAAVVVAGLVGGRGRIALLVGEEITAQLSSGPLAGTDLTTLVQPAIDAAATALSHTAEGALQIETTELVAHLGADFLVAPLIGTGFAAAVAVDALALGLDVPVEAQESPFQVETPENGAGGVVRDPIPEPLRPASSTAVRGIELLAGVDLELTVELGRARMAVRDLLALAPGDVIELDRAAGSPADLLVNGRLIARGEVVVVDEDFGLRITEIIESPAS